MVLEDCYDTFSRNMSNMTTEEAWTMLDEEQQMKAVYKIPTYVFLGIVFGIGIPGNILVLIVYSLRYPASTTKVFIMGMAVFDLFNCLNGAPLTTLTLGADYRRHKRIECTVLLFIASYFSFSSVFVLFAVAIDRYRRICAPLKRQITVKMSKVIVGAIVFLALFCSFPFLIVYHSKPVQLKDITVFACTTDKENKLNTFYHMLLGIIILSTAIILCVLYTFIVKAIYRQRKRRQSMDVYSNRNSNISQQSKDTDMSDLEHMPPSQEQGAYQDVEKQGVGNDDTIRTGTFQIGSLLSRERYEKVVLKPNQEKSFEEETKVTEKRKNVEATKHEPRRELSPVKLSLIMFYVTIGFIISYLPYACVRLHELLSPRTFDLLLCRPVYRGFFVWCLRGVFLNNALNPIIYGYCNVIFRKHCRDLFRTFRIAILGVFRKNEFVISGHEK